MKAHPLRRWLWAKWRHLDFTPPVGWVQLGSLRRVTPLSRDFGYDRGLPIDRHYAACRSIATTSSGSCRRRHRMSVDTSWRSQTTSSPVASGQPGDQE